MGPWRWTHCPKVLELLVVLLVGTKVRFASAFSGCKYYKPVVVVGKIIVDEYGAPNQPPRSVSIGGGGPQAAFGALAALSVWDRYYNKEETEKTNPTVLFVAPVGSDWTASETSALISTLNTTNTTSSSEIRCHLIQCSESEGYVTPRIRLWHDSDQVVHWYDINDSFGPNGADGLWRNRPSAADLLSILGRANTKDKVSEIVLHVIAEAGAGAAGGQLDCLPLVRDPGLAKCCSFVGIEPVASGDSLGEDDGRSAVAILHECHNVTAKNGADLFWCPDEPLDAQIKKQNGYDGLLLPPEEDEDEQTTSVTIVSTRDGPRGSRVWSSASYNHKNTMVVPAATLSTLDGTPIDPTGAGNAYSAAMTALLGNNIPLEAAACIATAVGAVVCEHEGLPISHSRNNVQWSTIVDRIYEAANEVESSLRTTMVPSDG